MSVTLTNPPLSRRGSDPAPGGSTSVRPFPRVGEALLLVPLAVLYWTLLRGLADNWWDDSNYSHGFLIPVFSGYLIWRDRERLRAEANTGSWLGLPVVLAGLGMLLLGQIGAENFLSRSSLIVVLAGLVWFHFGGRALRAVLFPLTFLLFMIPLPAIVFYAVAFPLQNLAAQNAAWLLDRLGLPVLLDGNVIQLANIALGVTEACSGIRSLISLLALATAWAYMTLPGLVPRAVFVAAAVPITLAANTMRIVVTGLIGQWFGSAYAEGFFHGFSGWLIFVFAFLCLLALHAATGVALRSWSRR
jgi:exosortase